MTFWFVIKINFENFETINTSHVLILYNPIKEHFRLEPYLENIVSKKLRSALTKIRVSSHSLRIHTGRYEGKELNVNIGIVNYVITVI